MSTKTVAIAPVRKSILVSAPQANAFETFTAGLDRWWPKKAHVGPTTPSSVTIEPRLGGRWYERTTDGTETDVGRILAWEPPHRFVVSWDIDCHWQPDRTVGTEVEIRFVAKSPTETRVELEHRGFERMGEEAGASLRKDVNGGWPSMLDLFKTAAEA
jgi:uncharacterized protein YndB with AHSA1/START domain